MKIKKSTIINIYLFLLIFYFFTNYIYEIQAPIIIILSIILIIVIGLKNVIKDIKNVDIALFIFPIFLSMIMLYSTNFNDSVKFVITIFCLTISCIILSKENGWEEKVIKYSLVFSFIHVFMTILYSLIPSIVQKINHIILSEGDFVKNTYEMQRNNINCGITPIQSLNAIYICVFIGIIFSKLLTNKGNKIINCCLIIFGMIALFLTSKRGVMVSIFVAVVFLLIYYARKVKENKTNIIKKTKKILPIIIIISIIIFFMQTYFNSAVKIFERFLTQQDITTGRIDLYSITWDYFLKNPITGNGLFFTQSILNTYTHNIYLQLLCETGVVGITLFAFLNICIIFNIFKLKNIKGNYSVIYAIFFYIVFMCYGMTGNPLFDYTILVQYYLSIAIINNAIIRIGGEKK